MIMVRDVFQAKYGRGDELVALFKEMGEIDATFRAARIYTDASGPFFTIVTEMDVESLAAWEAAFSAEMARPDFGDWFERMVEVTESGRREFYNVVS